MVNTGGWPGAGSAISMQTAASGANCQVELMTGQQSGGFEQVNAGATAGALTTIVNALVGWSKVMNTNVPSTLSTNAIYTLADGTFTGQRKAITVNGAMGVADTVVTVTTSTSNVSTVTMDETDEGLFMMWTPGGWLNLGSYETA